jgi:Ca-activated chloride channel homolog
MRVDRGNSRMTSKPSVIRSGNPRDEVFIVNFNDEHYLDQAFTNNLSKLKKALEKFETRGGTALYDAVLASAEYLKKNAQLEKNVLFVVTDGDDNASSETLEKAVARVVEGERSYNLLSRTAG